MRTLVPQNKKARRTVVFIFLWFISTVGVAKGDNVAATRKYSFTGIIRQIDSSQQLVTIQHDEIPGFMEAMTMDFPARDETVIAGLNVGDQVRGTLEVKGLGFVIVELQKQSEKALR